MQQKAICWPWGSTWSPPDRKETASSYPLSNWLTLWQRPTCKKEVFSGNAFLKLSSASSLGLQSLQIKGKDPPRSHDSHGFRALFRILMVSEMAINSSPRAFTWWDQQRVILLMEEILNHLLLNENISFFMKSFIWQGEKTFFPDFSTINDGWKRPEIAAFNDSQRFLSPESPCSGIPSGSFLVATWSSILMKEETPAHRADRVSDVANWSIPMLNISECSRSELNS